MFKVGDKVKFLNDVGGGVITKVITQNMVHVENEDGFEIPVVASEIILAGDQPIKMESPSVQDFVQQAKPRKVVEPEPEPEEDEIVLVEGNDEPNFQLAFVPDNERNPLDGAINIYLINDCNFFLLYHYSHLKKGDFETREAGKLEPNTKLLIGAILQVEIADLPEFCFQLIFYKDKASRMEKPVTRQIKVNPVRFYKAGSFTKSDFFRNKAMLFKLNESELEQAVEALTKSETKKVVRGKERARTVKKVEQKTDVVEVDLHIHELLDDTRGLSNADMLQVQMDKFREQMEAAIKGNARKVVFIHGMGNGTLKNELRRELSHKYKQYPFQDASFQEYGYGATMVILRRK
ncbi:DUF2027 domain-containing protein [Sunxiuqinia sp. A32]|uniref:DUF2027 domain-containing protein n=1 Tax=Sunxiuqinia sp. A32 TaxID=3461496 RepID=UPI0040454ED0